MEYHKVQTSSWARLAGVSGVAAALSYFGAALLPLPDVLGRLLAFAFGPLLMVSFLGLYRYLADHEHSIALQLASMFGIIAGLMLTTMLVVQIGNNMVRADLLATADSPTVKDSIKLSWGAVNRVQYLLDVVWDIFITISMMLFGYTLARHPRFGKLWGISGFLIGLALLVLNLQSFPDPPAEAGSVDLGPVAGLWLLAVAIKVLFVKHQPAELA